MEVLRQISSDSFVFKAGERKTTHFLFLLSDLSAFGNPAKKPMGIRGNYRKCMKLLLGNELNEFRLTLKDGEYFKIDSPVFSRGRSEKDVEEYFKMYKNDDIKVEPSHLDVQITIPAGNAIKVYSIEESFYTYLINEGGTFNESTDFEAVEAATGVFF